MQFARPEVSWSALASGWDTFDSAWNRSVAMRLIELAGLAPGMVTADMGCGTGAVTIAAAGIVHPARVAGIDSSAAMIIQAKKRASEASATNIEFWCEDATRPTFEPGRFDAVLSSMAVAYLPSPETALHAWRELLRPPGVLAFSWELAEDKEWQLAYDAVGAFLPAENRWGTYRGCWSVSEAEAMLPQEMDVSTVTEGITTRYESMQHWWDSSWTQATAVTWSQIPFALREDARRNAFTVLEDLKASDGSLEQTRVVCYTAARLS